MIERDADGDGKPSSAKLFRRSPTPIGGEPSVSVALATYNGERFLSRQLQSIAEQSVPPSELVVSDDVSVDRTLRILEDYAASVPFSVRVRVNNARLGFRANFMAASGYCTSDLIFFCDQDDIWHPRKIERMRAAFQDPEALLIYHGAAVVDACEQRYASLSNAVFERDRLAQYPLHPWHYSFGLVQAFRGELRAFDHLWPLSRDHVFDGRERLAHDQWYFFLALALGTVHYVDEELLLYRQHGANTFGANEERGAWRRLLARFPHDAAADARGSAAAARRADILRRMTMQSSRTDHARLLDIARRYDALASRLDRRYATYTRPSVGGRLAALGASIASGDYRGNPWAFDWRSISRDLVTGIFNGGAAA